MTLQKALEIGQDITTYEHSASHTDKGDAIKLLIEAGKRLQSARKVKFDFYALPLPGETEE